VIPIGSGVRGRTADRLNAWLDSTVGLAIEVCGRRVGSWTALAVLGAVVGSAVWVVLGCGHRLPPASVASAPACAAVLVAVAFRRARARHRLVWHRYAATGAAAMGGLAWSVGAPMAETFDIAAVSAVAGLALGRVGCHRVGCCFGGVARIGIRYPWWRDRARHAPLALIEAVGCLPLAMGGLCLLREAPSGVTALVLVSVYAVWRTAAQRRRDPHFRGRRRRSAPWGPTLGDAQHIPAQKTPGYLSTGVDPVRSPGERPA
jgi:prolipoprotein diacylglyceryltransferase